MARVVGRARPTNEGSTSMKLSEMIVIGLPRRRHDRGGIYYWQYRQKATYALSSFLGAVNSGRVKDQYDASSTTKTKQLLAGFRKVYENSNEVPLGLGYAERIPKFTLAPEVPDPKDPNVVSISATMQVVDGGGTKNLTDLASSKPYTDTFKLRKDKAKANGKSGSSRLFEANNGKLHLMASPPSPRSTY